MASTFSPALRLELPGTGDQSGSWGETTNTNLGTLLESAIAGVATVSVTSAAQALTVANGAADQARSAILVLTTTTGANFSVFAPPVPKVYVLVNNSSRDATIYNSTALGNTTPAGTGVRLTPGQSAIVFSNGTNFSTVTSGDLGWNQTWQDVRASRAAGVTYQNTTGRPISVAVQFPTTPSGSTRYFEVSSDGVNWLRLIRSGGESFANGTTTVPVNGYYRVTVGMPDVWAELR